MRICRSSSCVGTDSSSAAASTTGTPPPTASPLLRAPTCRAEPQPDSAPTLSRCRPALRRLAADTDRRRPSPTPDAQRRRRRSRLAMRRAASTAGSRPRRRRAEYAGRARDDPGHYMGLTGPLDGRRHALLHGPGPAQDHRAALRHRRALVRQGVAVDRPDLSRALAAREAHRHHPRHQSAVAPYDTTGYASPDWSGFIGEGAPRAIAGLPGKWGGIPFDFVTGEGDSGSPACPTRLSAACRNVSRTERDLRPS